MQKNVVERWTKVVFWIALALIIYMPLHVFIVQSASLVTGGLEVWKAAKDIFAVALVPLLLYIAFRRKLFHGEYKVHFILGVIYLFLHLAFILFDNNDDTYSAIVGSVYNGRLLIYLLIGLVVGSAAAGKRYLKWLMTATVLIASVVALFGVLQYFLPSDLLTHVGYSIERGVKPLFFIDDKPDLPRVMSTLRDPNSLGAYLIVPILTCLYALWKPKVNRELFVRPLRRGTLIVMTVTMLAALGLTFSRGAQIGTVLATVTLLYIVTGQKGPSLVASLKKYWLILSAIIVIFIGTFVAFKDSYFVQNVIFHADESTVLADPNELRVSFAKDAVSDIIDNPAGYGPGSAGLVSISNPQGARLTENYYLQIAYEVGIVGLLLFAAIIFLVIFKLYIIGAAETAAPILFASAIAYLFYSLLIHLWANEAIALQWWLLVGAVMAISQRKTKINQP